MFLTSCGEEEEDNMFNIVNEVDDPRTACSLNNANMNGLDPTNPNSTVFSDNGIRNIFKQINQFISIKL